MTDQNLPKTRQSSTAKKILKISLWVILSIVGIAILIAIIAMGLLVAMCS